MGSLMAAAAAASSNDGRRQAHAVLVPYPAQGHITPMMKLAKLLHSRGFYVTFVNTDYNHARLLRSKGEGGPHALLGLAGFRFESIPDGLPPAPSGADDATQDIPALCRSTSTTCLPPFRDLLKTLAADPAAPPPTCVVSDGCMSFTLDAAEELGLPELLFWTTSACGFMAYCHYKDLLSQGLTPFKNAEDLSSGSYLDTPIMDLVPGMENMRLRDFPSFIRTTDADDVMLNFLVRETARAARASAILLNTFHDLERPVLDAIAAAASPSSSMLQLPPVYTIGPLHLLTAQLPPESPVASMSSSLWKEDGGCLEWLDGRVDEPGSVVYVNFGSITVMSSEQLVEFAWGLANSGRDFLWVVRPDLVRGDDAVLPPEFLAETRGRGMLASWCPQEAVLSHPAVGGFLTHSGWNSTLESISAGVPMLCWPFFAEQQTNCRYACAEWGVGMEIDSDVRRGEVEALIGELMMGGGEMRKAAAEWKDRAAEATKPGSAAAAAGSSVKNLDNVVRLLLQQQKI